MNRLSTLSTHPHFCSICQEIQRALFGLWCCSLLPPTRTSVAVGHESVDPCALGWLAACGDLVAQRRPEVVRMASCEDEMIREDKSVDDIYERDALPFARGISGKVRELRLHGQYMPLGCGGRVLSCVVVVVGRCIVGDTASLASKSPSRKSTSPRLRMRGNCGYARKPKPKSRCCCVLKPA